MEVKEDIKELKRDVKDTKKNMVASEKRIIYEFKALAENIQSKDQFFCRVLLPINQPGCQNYPHRMTQLPRH